MELTHRPVLLDECINALNIRPDGIYVDGTLGGGGHAREVLGRLTTGRLIGIDQDDYAVARAGERLACFGERLNIVHDNFKNIRPILSRLGIRGVDGVLLDLGVSSCQFDDGARGFSYQHDARLDMRMSKENPLTAYDVVNTYSQQELTRVLRDYGEETFAPRIARKICESRQTKPVETTFELVELIKAGIPAAARREGGHPAKRSFQALRVEVNNELGILEQSIRDIVEVLNPGGRICIITFQSLEDRIVSGTYKKLATGCTCPPDFPVCVCGKSPVVRIITKKPILPGERELGENNRSHSARLRVAEKMKGEEGTVCRT